MAISFPGAGRLRLRDHPLLSIPESGEFAKFVSMLLDIGEVQAIEIASRDAAAEIRFDSRCTPVDFARKVGELLTRTAELGWPAPRKLKPDSMGRVELYRDGDTVSTWKVASDLPGRLRVRNSRLFRKKGLCRDIERELMMLLGVERFKVNSITCSALIFFDQKSISKSQLLEFLDEVLLAVEENPHVDRHKYELLACTVGLGLSATAQFAAPALLVPAGVLFVYCSIPTFVAASRTLFMERRLGVDVLDSIVVVMCLISRQIFAGAVLVWCLSFGRKLLEKAQEDSRRRLVNVFGKQPRTANLFRDGAEVSVPLDRIRPGDLVAVHTGEVVPVDGVISEGMAIIDQQALTGESAPVEKEVGSNVYASTLLIGGEILVRVERAGKETTSARISSILNDAATFRLTSQSRGEELADKAVIPTLALAAIGYGTVGLYGATAIINCDFGTGIRMAAPLALLSSLSVCANRGILVKDGRALEQIGSVDTILFDKTGTLTKERPIVQEIHRLARWDEELILTYAAAAERHLHHPIAAAILDEFRSLGMPFPATDQSSYRIGYGIAVRIGEHDVRVGSARFMKSEGVTVTAAAERITARAHEEGHMIVFVSLDGMLAGAIELAPTLREGIPQLIRALRARGVKEVIIISGDHEKPTRRLAQELGVDRYFSEVLPEDKARYVERLQGEGRRVCFVGDGINDAIALKRANVSVSLRGATSVAADTAQVVFMEENVGKLLDLIEISQMLDRNVRVSWRIILTPNLVCIGGAFFFGFGVMASVLANNVAAIAALANGLTPLRRLPAPPTRPVRLGRRRFQRLLDLFARPLARRRTPTRGLAMHRGTPGAPPRPLPIFKSSRRATMILTSAGVLGVLVPGIPGWPLLLVAIVLMSASGPGVSVVDRWIARRFPAARDLSLLFVHSLLRDVSIRYPEPKDGATGSEA